MKETTKITIRMDDITADMNWENFNKVVDLLREKQVYPLLGIVPKNEDPMLSVQEADAEFYEKMLALKEEGAVLAMHGVNHVYITKKAGIFPLNRFSEFAGVEKTIQTQRIESGKKELEAHGIETDIFMAPGHTFDQNTLAALKEQGFRYVTDGFGMHPYKKKGLVFFPIAFQKGKVFEKQGISTIVLHVNTWEEEDFWAFKKMLEEKESFFVSYKEWLLEEPKDQTSIEGIKEYLMAKAKWFLVKLKTMRARGGNQ